MTHRLAVLAVLLATAASAAAQSLSCLIPQPAAELDLGHDAGSVSVADGLLASHDGLTITLHTLDNPLRPKALSEFTLDELEGGGSVNEFVSPPAVLGEGIAVYGVSNINPLNGDTRTTYFAIDLSDPATPEPIGSIGSSVNGRVEVFGRAACIVTRYAMKIVDLSDPANPLITAFVGYNRITGVAVAGDRLYFCDSDVCVFTPVLECFDGRGLFVVDLSNPGNPVTLFHDPALRDYAHLTVHGDLLLAAHPDGLVVFDLTDPTTPVRVGVLPGLQPRSIHPRGSSAIVDDMDLGTVIVDLTDPANPRLDRIVPLDATLTGFTDRHGYASLGPTLGVYDLDRLASIEPPESAALDTPGFTREAAVVGDTALLADVTGGLQIADISDPLSPVLLGPVATPGSAYGVHVRGNLAFVAAGLGGMQILDITDPRNPVPLSTLDTPGVTQDIAVAGGYAFLAEGSTFPSLIVDISDPTLPTPVGVLRLSPLSTLRCKDLTITGTTLFAAASDSGLAVFDIAVPSNPGLIASVAQIGTIDAVTRTGDLLLLASPTGFVWVLDVSDPSKPTPVTTILTPGQPREIAVSGSLAFIADDTSGVQVVDLTDPANPSVVLHQFPARNRATNVTVADDHLFISDDAAGLSVVDLSRRCEPCVADRNGDAIADTADIQLFVSDFLAGELQADLNADGIVDSGDIQTFIAAFLAGC